jgi:hypothetical protein
MSTGNSNSPRHRNSKRHLAHCEDCTMILDQTKKSIEILCDSEPIPLPPDLHSRLRTALREKFQKKVD